jgi:branched-chain amino acid transport system permease protein
LLTKHRWRQVPLPKVAIGWGAVVVVAWVLAAHLLRYGLPSGIVLQGLVFGLLNSLGAVSLVLVFRAGHYINFAQGAIGAAAATLAFRLIEAKHMNWFPAVGLGLLTAVVLSGIFEVVIIQRLFKASRLIVTVGTIAIALFATSVAAGFQALITSPNTSTLEGAAPQPPLPLHFAVGIVQFRSSAVLTLILCPLLLVALAVYLRRSPYGAVVEAAAQNPERAQLLGVSVRSLSTFVWLLVGLLAGVAAILSTSLSGTIVGSSFSPDFLLLSLAPAVIAGLRNLPGAVIASLLLGIVESAVSYNVSQGSWIDLIYFLVVVLALLVQTRHRGREAQAEERSFAVSTSVRPIPRELRSLPSVRISTWSVALVLLAVALLVPTQLSISQRFLAGVLVSYALAALSITVLTGMAGQVSLGQWAFVGFGGLLGGYLAGTERLPFLEGLVLIPVAGAVAAVVVGLSALRIRGLMLAASTMAFAIAAADFLFQRAPFTSTVVLNRPKILGVNLASQLTYYYFCLAILLLVLLGLRNLRSSGLGRAIVAARDNEVTASAYGVAAVRVRLAAFAVSGFIAALGGYLYLYSSTNLDSSSFSALTSLMLLAYVVIGGLGSWIGAVIAALLYRGVVFFLPGWAQFLVSSVGLIVILMFLPGGIGSAVYALRDRLLRGYASRRGIRVPSLVADTRVHDGLPERAAAPGARQTTGELVASGRAL